MMDKKVKTTFIEFLNEKKTKNKPCWTGYKMIGMKNKNGRKVPNCVKAP